MNRIDLSTSMPVKAQAAPRGRLGALISGIRKNIQRSGAGVNEGLSNILVILMVTLVICGILALIGGITVGVCYLMGCLIGKVMNQFGVHQPTWVWAICWFIVSSLFMRLTSNGSSKSSDYW